jgi:hypothetical protein
MKGGLKEATTSDGYTSDDLKAFFNAYKPEGNN